MPPTRLRTGGVQQAHSAEQRVASAGGVSAGIVGPGDGAERVAGLVEVRGLNRGRNGDQASERGTTRRSNSQSPSQLESDRGAVHEDATGGRERDVRSGDVAKVELVGGESHAFHPQHAISGAGVPVAVIA